MKSDITSQSKKLQQVFVVVALLLFVPLIGFSQADKTFDNDNSDGLLSEATNWDGDVGPSANDNLIISAGLTLEVNQNFTCGSLQLMQGASFFCSGSSILTITGNIKDYLGNDVIIVNSSIEVTSSIQIPQPLAPPVSPPDE